MHYLQKGFKACLARNTPISLVTTLMFLWTASLCLLAYLSLYWALYLLCLMSHNKIQRQNISTRIALDSSQRIDRSKTNSAKLIDLLACLEKLCFVGLLSWLETCSKQRS